MKLAVFTVVLILSGLVSSSSFAAPQIDVRQLIMITYPLADSSGAITSTTATPLGRYSLEGCQKAARNTWAGSAPDFNVDGDGKKHLGVTFLCIPFP